MPDFIATEKFLMFRYLGVTLPITLANFPWLSNVLKIVTFTTPNGAGANAQTATLGAANGQTVGGTLQMLTTNRSYYLISASIGYTVPDATKITELGFVPAGVIIADGDGYTPLINTRPIPKSALLEYLRPGADGLDALIAAAVAAGGGGTGTPGGGGTGATPLNVDFNPSSNLTRTGNNVAATSPGAAAGTSPLRLLANTLGSVEFLGDAGSSAFLQLQTGSALPTGNTSGKYGIQRDNNRGVAVFGGNYTQASSGATASAGTKLRLERESDGGSGYTMNWKHLPVNGGANDWVTFSTQPDDGSELRLAAYLPNEQLAINGIVTNGFV